MKYRYREGSLFNADGRQIIVLLCVSCTKKFRDEAGKLLAAALSEVEKEMIQTTYIGTVERGG